MLFALWTDMPIRYTRDIDLLGFQQEDLESISHTFKQICTLSIDLDDKVFFDASSLSVDFIRENSSYGGIRVDMKATLDGVNRSLPVQIDIGFGDTITPCAEIQTLSTILDFPKPKLKTYNAETVIAEKFEAMVSLGIANSRLKDFFDIYSLISNEAIHLNEKHLKAAIRNTFNRRRTGLSRPEPIAFSPEYYENQNINNAWNNFCKRNKITNYPSFNEVIEVIKKHLQPIYHELNGIKKSVLQ